MQRVVLVAHEECAFHVERLQISPLQLESQQREDIKKGVKSFDRTIRVDAFFAHRHRHYVRFERIELC